MTNDTGNGGGGTGAKSGKMDSRIGLEYIVENSDYVNKLGLALDTSNATVKKQVFELLSALCAYSSNGYKRAIETLEYYKNIKGERYRLNLVVVELDKATSVEYQIALLAFINCVIISAATLQDRIRMRNEFIGLNLLPVLNNLRRIASNVPDIGVQIDVFDEQRECDESQSLQGPDGINLNSHLDVFYAILRQVAGTPQEIPFLSILQHLLQIDPKEPISDIVWDTAETLVHRATLLEDKEASVRLLRSPSIQKFACPHCRSDITSPTRRQSVGAPLTPGPGHTQQTTTIPGAPAPPPPPPPPNLAAAAAPPPPPPPPCAPPPPPPLMAGGPAAPRGGGPPVPPAPPAPNLLSVKANEYARPKTPEAPVEVIKPLPQQETPVPRAKMKTINWNKIPPQKVFGKPNIWSIVADSHQDSPMADLNWDEMEGLFCLQQTQGSPKLGRENSGNSDTLERKSRKENEITLLDGKRSLNVNIFLKQFRSSNEDIIQLIRNGEHEDIGAEKLRGLLKILPEVDELEMLKAFDGDNNRLGNAEKFLLQLIQVPNYKLRIEGMLLKEEFKANLIYLEPNINAMLYAGEDLMNNKALQEVLYMVVVAGNFLNSGGYAGNAAGVKLSSLQKLTDIRANKPGMNLIHFVALQAEKKNCELLEFPGQMSTLENAAKTTVEQISNEINAIDQRIKKIKRQIELPKTEEDIKYQMVDFINASERDIVMLQRGLKELEAMRLQLADFFCEDVASFKMEECFKIFHNFCEKFSQAVKDNEKRRVQEEQALVRRKQREEQLALKRRQSNQPGTPVSDSENSLLLLDPSQYDMRYSPAMSRRRIGSFTSNGEPVMLREDCASPDITPNGSLRRRRSRVLSEEDEGNLMDFLRSSGHENGSRERKSVSSYGGSLDRSWARRARSGSGSKKRPDLLNVDFGTDRERPSSPSPLAESKPLPVEENKPREWRQKIESWLQANEADEKQNDDYKKKRKLLAVNRRSYETDNESDRGGSKLDPLPEEKPPGTATSSPEKPESGGGAGMGASSLQSPTTYKRVYPDWKPSSALEKTDVVGTMEAIADAIPSSQDKSAWRKSSLNSHQEDLDARRYRRQRSRENAAPSSSLQSILEEDKRKSVIQSLGERPPSDRLQIYIRRGSDNGSQPESTVTSPKQASSSEDNKQSIYIRQQMTAADSASAAAKPKPTEKQSSIYIRPTTTTTNTSDNTPSTTISSVNSSCTSTSDTNQLGESSSTAAPAVVAPPPRRARRTHHIYDEKTNNKIEIDSDNIETPPSIRKSFSRDRDQTVSSANSCRKIHDQKGEGDVKGQSSGQVEPEVLGDGQFDRFSLTRRTRRFKRPVDMSSGNETTSPESLPDNPLLSSDVPVRSPVVAAVAEIESTEKQKELRLKRWQDKLNNPGAASEGKGSEALARAARTGRNMSRISQEDVRKAIRSLKSPTPERSWSPPKEIGTVKLITHELNDEGFEETQSLVSDTPSHGKDSTSSCNDYGSDSKNNNNNTKKSAVKSVESSPRRQLPVRSAGSALPSILITKNTNQSALERSKSLRGTPPSLVNKNLLPRRTNSMRKSESPLAATSSPTAKLQHQLDVERSNSRTSLRSSRSSLSSAVSTNTVKKVPLRPKSSPLSGTTSGLPTSSLSLHSSPSKRPLSANSARTPLSGTPASRSSSSGSSIGPSAVAKKPPLKATSGVGPSTSFKENQNQNTVTAARSRLQSKTPSNTSIAGGGASSTSSGSTTRMAAASSSSRVGGGAANAAGSGSRTGGFMRPTTSSATKVKGK